MQRLNKFIASSGLCSRRKADELIEGGHVPADAIGQSVRYLSLGRESQGTKEQGEEEEFHGSRQERERERGVISGVSESSRGDRVRSPQRSNAH